MCCNSHVPIGWRNALHLPIRLAVVAAMRKCTYQTCQKLTDAARQLSWDTCAGPRAGQLQQPRLHVGQYNWPMRHQRFASAAEVIGWCSVIARLPEPFKPVANSPTLPLYPFSSRVMTWALANCTNRSRGCVVHVECIPFYSLKTGSFVSWCSSAGIIAASCHGTIPPSNRCNVVLIIPSRFRVLHKSSIISSRHLCIFPQLWQSS